MACSKHTDPVVGEGSRLLLRNTMSFHGAWLLHNLPVPLPLQHTAWSGSCCRWDYRARGMQRCPDEIPWDPGSPRQWNRRWGQKILRHMGTGKSLCSQSRAGSVPPQPQCTGLCCLAHLQAKWIPVNSSSPAHLGDAWRTLPLFHSCALQLCLLWLRALLGMCLSSLWSGKSRVQVWQKWGALGNVVHDTLNIFSRSCKSYVVLYSQGKCKLSLFSWPVRFRPLTPGVVVLHNLKNSKNKLKKLLLCFCEAVNPNSAWVSLGLAAAVGLFNPYIGAVIAGYCEICFCPSPGYCC